MAAERLSVAILPALSPDLRRRERRTRLTGLALMSPAVLLTLLFLLFPLIFILQMSFTVGSSFLSPTGAEYSPVNYLAMTNRYLPNVLITMELAALSMIVDLIFGFPFAYILVRKVRYRELVRAFMVFPMFGALYIAFGLRFLLLPGGPASPVLNALGISNVSLLYGLPSVVFAMAIFTFPFMVMNIGTALSNVDPKLEEAAACLGARPWQTFTRILLPLTRSGIVAGHAHGLRLEHRHVRRAAAPRHAQRAALAGRDALPARRRPVGLRPLVGDEHGPAGDRLRGVVPVSLRYSRGALV